MKILVVGGGGREHALAWKIKQSPKCSELFIAPGNPGTASLGSNVDIAADDIDALKEFALSNGINSPLSAPKSPWLLASSTASKPRV